MAGRPPKSTAEHKRNGTFKATRHGNRVDSLMSTGKPRMPKGLSLDAQAAWKLIVKELPPEALNPADCFALELACNSFAMARQAAKVGDWKTQKEASLDFRGWASRFGLTPVDRAKIAAPVKEEGDELDDLAKLRVI